MTEIILLLIIAIHIVFSPDYRSILDKISRELSEIHSELRKINTELQKVNKELNNDKH